jgi:hypothetical protein
MPCAVGERIAVRIGRADREVHRAPTTVLWLPGLTIVGCDIAGSNRPEKLALAVALPSVTVTVGL